MNQKVERVKLKNGLEVVFIFDPRFTTSTVQMNFKIGWRHDEKKYLGIAHLFEHLVGKRTQKYPGKSEFTEALERMGIESNAYTTADYTCYYQNQTCENVLTSLNMLYEAIYNTNFLADDLEKEKDIVMNESREYEDNDDHLLWREMMKNIFPGTTLNQNLFGNLETMKNITLVEFENFYKNYKNPKNSFLVVATKDSKQKQKVLKFLNSFYQNFNKQKGDKFGKIFSKIKEVESKLIAASKISKPDRKQSNLRVAYKLWKFNKKERLEFFVLQQILTGGFAGKIFKKLRDELGLTYGISLWADSMYGFNYCTFSSMAEKDKKDILIKELKNELKKLQETLVQKDIEDVKELLLFRENRSTSANGEAGAMASSIVMEKDFIDSKIFKDYLKKIQITDIKKLMLKIFKEDSCSVSVLE
jgi:zinc protease